MSSPSSDQPSVTLAEFIQQVGASRFISIRDGQPYCLAPDDPEALALYQEVMAALAAGTITTVSNASRMSDG
jgi:hypothetical protein